MNGHPHAWQEVYLGGSELTEKQLFAQFAKDMLDIQKSIAKKSGTGGARTLHAKIIVGVKNARVLVDQALPPHLAAGYFQPGAEFSATVRFSNASPYHQGDAIADLRGVALRINISDESYHDLLMTSFPVSHARNASQFVAIAKIAAGSKALLLPNLLLKLGLSETIRVIKNIKAASQPLESLAVQQFWSRAALLWGKRGPVRYALKPMTKPAGKAPQTNDPDCLATEFAQLLRARDVSFRLALQEFVNEELTPIEDGATEWKESHSPFIEVATLTIPKQDLNSAMGLSAKALVDGTAFNPWICPPEFRPLGNLNRARGPVYRASAQGWLDPARSI